jgi:hypothetical protein
LGSFDIDLGNGAPTGTIRPTDYVRNFTVRC